MFERLHLFALTMCESTYLEEHPVQEGSVGVLGRDCSVSMKSALCRNVRETT